MLFLLILIAPGIHQSLDVFMLYWCQKKGVPPSRKAPLHNIIFTGFTEDSTSAPLPWYFSSSLLISVDPSLFLSAPLASVLPSTTAPMPDLYVECVELLALALMLKSCLALCELAVLMITVGDVCVHRCAFERRCTLSTVLYCTFFFCPKYFPTKYECVFWLLPVFSPKNAFTAFAYFAYWEMLLFFRTSMFSNSNILPPCFFPL